jgi:hypothetical protein
MSILANVRTSSRWWVFPAITFVSVLLWYLTDTVRSSDAYVHLVMVSAGLLAVSLAAITSAMWKLFPKNALLVTTLTLVSIVACVLAYANAAPFVTRWADSVSPTVKILMPEAVRVVLLWSGLLAASIFLMAHSSFQSRAFRAGLWIVMGVSFALLLLAIFVGPVD